MGEETPNEGAAKTQVFLLNARNYPGYLSVIIDTDVRYTPGQRSQTQTPGEWPPFWAPATATAAAVVAAPVSYLIQHLTSALFLL